MSSLILRVSMRLVVPLTLMFGFYMFFKGHDEPGGGFIGGLVVAVGLVLFRLTHGAEDFQRMLPIHPRFLVFAGLAAATLTAIFPLLLGYPLLTSYVEYVNLPFGERVHFASALFFDIGVLLVVVGVSIGMIDRLSRELEQ